MILIGLMAILSPTLSVDTPARTVAEEASVVINEVLYDPAQGDGEWVEIYNAGHDVNVEGFSLSDRDGHRYTLPDLSFPEASYLLLVVGPGEDRGVVDGYSVLHMGFSGPILNNDGDDLLLEGHGRVLDFFCFGRGAAVDPPPPQAPWDGCAETVPGGLSLSLQPNGLEDAQPGDWRASTPTPGSYNGIREGRNVLLSEVYYSSHRDIEYVAVVSQDQSAVDIGGWRLYDGEGYWEIPSPSWLEPQTRFVIAENATALFEDAGIRSDVCLLGCNRLISTQGSFVLANAGDEVVLLDPYGAVRDAFHYGPVAGGEGWEGKGASLLTKGHVARRKPSGGFLQDTDTAADWDWGRTFRLGSSSRPVREFEEVLVKPFIAPDESLPHLLSLLNWARRDIVLSGFKLTSPTVGEALLKALARGVRVQIGLEGSPPGGLEEDQDILLSELGSAGARVVIMKGGQDTPFRRYALHHAKYVIVDNTRVLMGSENFSENGFPAMGVGNRGWGVVVHSSAFASHLLGVALEDWNPARSDVRVLHGLTRGGIEDGVVDSQPPTGDDYLRASARLLLSPDNSVSPKGLPHLILQAEASIDAELFYLRQDWLGRPNPLLQQLLEASNRGVHVRLLLDGTRYNVEGEDDNDEAAIRLNRLAEASGFPLEVRLFSQSDAGLAKLHNKGLIVDGEEVLVSSMNWNYHGAYENRETGLHMSSGPLGVYFLRSFEEDWRSGHRPSGIAIRGPHQLRVGEEGIFIAEVQVGGPVASYAWDLHADGVVDGIGSTYSFIPQRPGITHLRLVVKDAEGGLEGSDIEISVISPFGGLPGGLDTVLGVSAAVVTLLLFRKLRMVREPTNKDSVIKRREGPSADRRGRD